MNERNVLDLYTKGTNKLEGLESITSAQTSIPIKVFNLPSINNLIALMTVVRDPGDSVPGGASRHQ
jgi:hypothetical protein